MAEEKKTVAAEEKASAADTAKTETTAEEKKPAAKKAADKPAAEKKPAAKKPAAKAEEKKDGEAKPAAKKETTAKKPAEKKADAKKSDAEKADAVKKSVAKKKPAIVITEQSKEAKKTAKVKAGTLKITMKSALTGCNKKQIAVAHSLGLKHSGDVALQPDNAATQGKIAKISFLLSVTKA